MSKEFTFQPFGAWIVVTSTDAKTTETGSIIDEAAATEIKTKLQTASCEVCLRLYDECETQVEMWSEKNINRTGDIQGLIGDHEYTLIVTVIEEGSEEKE